MRASLRTIIAAVFICLSLGVGSASAASPGPRLGTLVLPDVWGWVVARHPTTNQYTPAPQDRQNSLGTTNRMRRDGAGIYDALYPQLEPGALNAGTALVAAFGQARDTFCANDDKGHPLVLEVLH